MPSKSWNLSMRIFISYTGLIIIIYVLSGWLLLLFVELSGPTITKSTGFVISAVFFPIVYPAAHLDSLINSMVGSISAICLIIITLTLLLPKHVRFK